MPRRFLDCRCAEQDRRSVKGRFHTTHWSIVLACSGQENTGQAREALAAEEVEKVKPDLVVRDGEGKVNTVRYEAVNAMLLNEFLKEHRKVQEQEASITQLRSTMAKQEAIIAQQQKGMEAVTARLDEQASQIQKVSAQLAAASPSPGGLEATKFATGRIRGGRPAPQVVKNP